MKFSSALPFASTLVSVLAVPAAARSRVFSLKTANSSNNELNNFWIENFGNHASFNTSGQVVKAYFADDGSRRLIVNGLDGTEDNVFLIPETPNSAVSNLVFADAAISESRSSEWGITNDKLVYGSEDRFYAFPTTTGTGWEIRWVDEDAVIPANTFPVHLAVEYLA
ncbi:unnamed protein product [Tuber melanosporum]|jgi:lipopolysaccharide export LptBFGC system permease protein LptF|uniref:(Perigord truffle) hypothetical protein n=1 Tax=Tuber melanosporum (strain Mel28) TaxID=656061 RepID=D5G4L2_TUBMM|nr:uncharacterized protein GSTUM_00004208001 [Tuber melanosporum]CAZ79455.1 unnamed protein product [Tuber melanosporum]